LPKKQLGAKNAQTVLHLAYHRQGILAIWSHAISRNC